MEKSGRGLAGDTALGVWASHQVSMTGAIFTKRKNTMALYDVRSYYADLNNPDIVRVDTRTINAGKRGRGRGQRPMQWTVG